MGCAKKKVKIAGYVEEQDVTCIHIQFADSPAFYHVMVFITEIRINKIECIFFFFPISALQFLLKKVFRAQIDNGWGIKCYPCLYIVCPFVPPNEVCSLSGIV